MKKYKLICSAIAVATLFQTIHANIVVWPPPPEKARISFEKVATKADDFGIEKGFFAKIWDFFAGSEPDLLVKPYGVHVDGDRLFVSDMAQRSVTIFDMKQETQEKIDGFKDQKFESPIDIATDAKNNIYITDSTLKAVFIFNKKLEPIRRIYHPNTLLRPTGIAIDKKRERLYVADTITSHIKVYKLDGTYIDNVSHIGEGVGELNKPTFLTLDSSGNLYVCDSMNRRVLKFDPDGKYLREYGQAGDSIGSFSSPRGIAVDRFDNLYVADTLFDAVQIFNSSGELLLVFGRRGVEPGEFTAPQDISITKDGKIYITDSFNMRVQVFNMLDYK